ncbi:MAG: hypothetical protein JO197_20480 [Acidobacteria bacterium]|nr:hypothetical protein [Acidobacteriota bacterium]MBV9474523.1 hypothetical protein [Acidobacteriota bacterium]
MSSWGLLRDVKDADRPEPFTVNGFISLGARADYTLRTRPRHMRHAPQLRKGLHAVVSLAAIRDHESIALSASAPKTPTGMATALLDATLSIAACVDLRPTELSGVTYETDAAAARQRFRERGERNEE